MFPIDLHDFIVSFIDNFKDLLNWRHVCHNTFHNYTAQFYCSRMYPFIQTPYVNITNATNLNLLIKRSYIKNIIIHTSSIQDKYIKELKNLEYLNIDTYTYNLTNSAFKNLTNLKTMIYNNNTDIDDIAISRLTNLTNLSCFNCIKITANALAKLTNLAILDCSSNQYLDTSFVRHLTKLECLTIDGNVQNDISNLTPLVNLKVLNIRKLGIIPEILRVLPNIIYLKCGEYDYHDIHITTLTKLKELVCGTNCVFTDLSILNLKNLTILKLNKSKSVISDNAINGLINLTELNCGYSQITDNAFKLLTKLQSLQCERNITITNEALQYLPNLLEFRCGHNTNFTDSGVILLTKLVILNCEHNTNLTDISLLNLPNLKILCCGINHNFRSRLSNQITSIEWSYNDDPEFMEFIQAMNCRHKLFTRL